MMFIPIPKKILKFLHQAAHKYPRLTIMASGVGILACFSALVAVNRDILRHNFQDALELAKFIMAS